MKDIIVFWVIVGTISIVLGIFGISGGLGGSPYGNSGCYYSDCEP